MRSAAYAVLLVACGGAVEAVADAPGPVTATTTTPDNSRATTPSYRVDSGTMTTSPDAGRDAMTSPVDAGIDATIESQCVLTPVTACKAPQHVSTVAEIVAGANNLAWYEGEGVLRATDDFIADVDIEAAASDFVPVGTCTGEYGGGCNAAISPLPASGVSCAIPLQSPCVKVVIAKGATFRIRRITQHHLPSSDLTRLIAIASRCAENCASGALCPATNTCLEPGLEWCQSCEGRSYNVCTCRTDACTAKPIGESCTWSGGDYGGSGHCAADGCHLP